MKKIIARLSAIIVILGILVLNANAQKEPVDYVNPYMGNISHLLVPTYPTIHLPNSILRVYPERGDFTGDLLRGLPLVVISHRGSSAFNLSPFQGDEKDIRPVISYSYDQEQLTPYSYSVYLDDQQTGVKFGLSQQSAAYELSFGQKGPAYLILNSRNGALTWDGEAVSGYQSIQNNTRVFIYMKPELKPESISVLKESSQILGTTASGRNACLVLKYPTSVKKINLRYGVSFIDESQARKNMIREIGSKDLKTIQAEGTQRMERNIGKDTG